MDKHPETTGSGIPWAKAAGMALLIVAVFIPAESSSSERITGFPEIEPELPQKSHFG